MKCHGDDLHRDRIGLQESSERWQMRICASKCYIPREKKKIHIIPACFCTQSYQLTLRNYILESSLEVLCNHCPRVLQQHFFLPLSEMVLKKKMSSRESFCCYTKLQCTHILSKMCSSGLCFSGKPQLR